MRKYKLGCNWSNALKNLIMRNSINIDYIKAGEQKNFNELMQEMRELRPILLHGGIGQSLRTGMEDVNSNVDFQYLNNLIFKCGTPQYGIHIALNQNEYKKMLTNEKIYSHMSFVIRIFKEKLKVPLLLENTPDCMVDRRFYKFVPYILPDQINKLLHDNDVPLLLDITHAKITAIFHGWNVYSYLDTLLLNRVKEIHINGCGLNKNGFIMDSHQKMDDEDFALLEWVLSRTNPQIISYEYSGSKGEELCDIEDNIRKFFDYFS